MPTPSLEPAEKKALDTFVAMLRERLPDTLESVQLFGSKARGDSGPNSDIDIMVVLRETTEPSIDAVYDVVLDIVLDEGIYLSTLTRGLDEYLSAVARRTEFIQNVAEEGIVLWSRTGEPRPLLMH